MSTITAVTAYQIYDSRGNPTIEAEMTLASGARGLGTVPSGASTGQFEALELRDGDKQHFRGKSVFKAIDNVNTVLAPAMLGMAADDQAAIDAKLIAADGTPNKSKLGANAILAVSMAAANAMAAEKKIPLHQQLGNGTLIPLPQIQILGGGAHADWRTDIQDVLVIASGANNYEQVMEITHNVYHAAKDLMRQRGATLGLADEGGFWPDVKTNEEAIQIVVQAIEQAGYTPGRDVSIALDIAASDLFDPSSQTYHFRLENRKFSSQQFGELITGWAGKYPIISIEDPMADEDWTGWQSISATLGGKIQLIGDDLFTTNTARIKQGIERKTANSVLIKLNQIGTVTETLAAIRLTQQAGWTPVVSARSGETEDTFIAHLAVATNAGQLKVGSFARSERMVKWNELIRIAKHLGDRATWRGAEIFRRG